MLLKMYIRKEVSTLLLSLLLLANVQSFAHTSLSTISTPSINHPPVYNANINSISSSNQNRVCNDSIRRIRGGSTTTQVNMLSPAAASLLAGSVAGAVGVGVAFPFDTMKTKCQILGKMAADMSMLAVFKMIWKTEGLRGFFSGVRAMMAGKALVKAVAFWAYTFALNQLNGNSFIVGHPEIFSHLTVLIIASSWSGFVSSFIVTPVERVKVMMQAQDKTSPCYENEFDCMKSIVRSEGITGLMGRGLNPTIAREVPSYCLNFVVYQLLIDWRPLMLIFDNLAPLVAGAISGVACWIPTYPMDVVKTLVQNTTGTNNDKGVKSLDIVKQLYKEGGVGAFFNGITPKLYRAAISHAVTFWVYELSMSSLRNI